MTDPTTLKEELIAKRAAEQPTETIIDKILPAIIPANNIATTYTNRTPLDQHETLIIISILACLTAGLISGYLSEKSFIGLIGTFLGYTFGRIFNGWQGKE